MKQAKIKHKRNAARELKIAKQYRRQNRQAQKAGLDPKGSNQQLLDALSNKA